MVCAEDDALATAADLYRGVLQGCGELTELPLTGYDTTGVPVWATVWDPPAGNAGSGDAHGVGYGATDLEAQVGALGELAERVVLAPTLRRLATGARRATYAELVAEVGPRGVADPLALVLPAGSPYTPATPLAWVPAVRWGTGETVLVPAELAAFDAATLPAGAPPGGWLTTPVSNGLGAGESIERAVAHAVLELLQRDGDTVAMKATPTGPEVDLDSAATGPGDGAGIADAVSRLRRAGVEPVVTLAATDPVTVVVCHGSDESAATPPMAVGAVGEAAHPDGPTAVRKALLEFASSRARRVFAFGPVGDIARLSPAYWAAEQHRPMGEQEPRALAEMARWSGFDVAAAQRALAGTSSGGGATTRVPLAQLPTAAADLDPPAMLALLLTRLREQLDPAPGGGADVLVVASDPVSADHGGAVRAVRAVKVLVPTLEVETMSYARIGERVARRLLESGSPLVGRGLAQGGAHSAGGSGRRPVRLTAAATERLGGPVWFDVDAAAAAVGDRYSQYREPRRHAVARLGAGTGGGASS